jgi:hypothetical protein
MRGDSFKRCKLRRLIPNGRTAAVPARRSGINAAARELGIERTVPTELDGLLGRHLTTRGMTKTQLSGPLAP